MFAAGGISSTVTACFFTPRLAAPVIPSAIEPACREALRHYSQGLRLESPAAAACVPVSTGLSAARVWRVTAGGRDWALRRWPPDGPEPQRLAELHRWLAHLEAAALPVAVPQRSDVGATFITLGDGLWQLEPWRPGEPELTDPADAPRVAAALQGLARLHRASAAYRPSPAGARWFQTDRGPAPAVAERLDKFAAWSPTALREARDRLRPTTASHTAAPLRRILEAAPAGVETLRPQLQAAQSIDVPLCPCLRDARPDHFLFTGAELTGIIDPSSARTDTVVADLTRLLGGYCPQLPRDWRAAMAAYESVRPLSAAELQLLPLLDASNTLLSGLTWVERAVVETEILNQPPVQARIASLADRIAAMFG